ncbi:MAG: ornithine--oxo-acid transaminase [Acidobacteria bacterium]|nr:ornithine--oxo-acid transaminase [Acidobacteriota bacterium]
MVVREFVDLEEQYGARNYEPLDVVLERGEGAWVWDIYGRRYLDCLAGYSAVSQGHCHPRILDAAIAQARRLTMTSRAFRNDQLPLLYEQLHELTGMEMALLMNSGAEAVETAIKAARKWGYTVKGIPPGQAEVIACANNFHGRTLTLVSFSTVPQYRDGFAPFTPGFRIVPFGDADALEEAIGPNTCAFLVEPIQGEAGVVIPPAGYLTEVARICRRRAVLFMADEIQSGLGRTGKLFAYMHDEDARPDVLIIGKALSGGFYPVSAVLSSREVLGVFGPGDHGSTFGGNPLACAVARAALDVIEDEKLPRRAEQLGTYFLAHLEAIRAPIVRDLRGRGLWIGIELNRPARPVCEALAERGLLCKETHERVIRLSPPLVITSEQIDWAVERLDEVLWTASVH